MMNESKHCELVHFQLEETVASFELAWNARKPPLITEFVSTLESTKAFTLELLAELCTVDLEHRWRTGLAWLPDDSLGSRPSLQDYQRCFGQFPGLAFHSSQIAEEYRVRRLWGNAPTPDQFLSSFPSPMPQLIKELRRIDQELACDDVAVNRFSRSQLVVEEDPRAPLPFSDFILHEMIGAGGIGKVYRATQRSLGRNVAVKALAKSLQYDPIAVDRFVEEARTLARLSHPNIVGVHGLGRFPGGSYFLVMDYVAGQNLDEYHKSNDIAATEAARIVVALAEAIDFAHSQGVVHCDLKPTNVLVAKVGRLLISDFGFAELLQYASPTSVDRRGGTVGFTAPEWLEDELAAPHPTIDVFGLGAILAKLLANCSNVNEDLRAIRDRALSRHPADRYQTAGDMATALVQLGLRTP